MTIAVHETCTAPWHIDRDEGSLAPEVRHYLPSMRGNMCMFINALLILCRASS